LLRGGLGVLGQGAARSAVALSTWRGALRDACHVLRLWYGKATSYLVTRGVLLDSDGHSSSMVSVGVRTKQAHYPRARHHGGSPSNVTWLVPAFDPSCQHTTPAKFATTMLEIS
jgi:hypothetical protein